MSWKDISFNIMSPSRERKLDNVTYMLCMLIDTQLGGCLTSMIKWSNAYLSLLKFVRQKVRSSGNWYLLMLNVLEVFDFVCGDNIGNFLI